MIYGERVRQARELAGLTQKVLAHRIGVHQSAIAQIESERISPTISLIEAIAEETDVIPGFFEQAPPEDFPIGSLVYRARSSVKASERDRAYQYTKLQVEQVRRMSQRLNLPTLVGLKNPDDPRKAARLTRVSFGLEAEKPIPHLINLLEREGFLIIALPIELEKIDAFSTIVTIDCERPVIVISLGSPGDRLRFSVAHELGHFVLHKRLSKSSPSIEKEADSFAAEFLLPETSARQILSTTLTLGNVARLKPRWGMSMQAIIHHAHDLGIITDRRYRYLFQQLSQLGWRKEEPSNLEVEREKPRSFRKMVDLVYGTSNEIEGLAVDMKITPQRARSVLSEYDAGLRNASLENTMEYLYPLSKEEERRN